MRNPDIGGYNGRANDVVQSMRTPHGSSTSDTFDGRLSSARSSIFLTAASSSEDVYTESMQSSVVTIRNRPRGLQAGDDSIRQDQQKPSRNQFLGLPIVVVGNCAPDLAERQPAHEVATHTFFEQDYEYPAVLNGQDTLHCETCNVDFHGKHRTGSWRRHNRLKHSGQTRTYPCSSINCELVFQRSDARLKHYRKYHLDLASSPEPRPREYAIQRRLERNENGGRNEHQTGVVPQEMDLDFNSVRMEIECSSAETDSNDAQFSRLGQAHDLLGINRCVTPATPSYAFQETSWQDPKRSSH
ncbi:hypothetical protein T440DRAFT_384541 [Plenodomus tracheiphilus IPT5]|uniref:C2H2-type domain-containing protein n=1 Tax=Plenodomus tracheiphilus IPT5 TaxID=1408161 RepID=A0A6A7BN56_9PLEO|nr:hypothetical protein T440DRAFT_384541 [Plenodomus tracheiphilus IPT5]